MEATLPLVRAFAPAQSALVVGRLCAHFRAAAGATAHM